MKLTVINGNRDKLECRLLNKIQNGENYQVELEKMRPKGKLSVVTNSRKREHDWTILNGFVDL